MIEDPDTAAIRSAVVAMLPETLSPWSVRVRRNHHDVGWAVDVSHEASSGFGLLLRRADVDAATESAARGLGQ